MKDKLVFVDAETDGLYGMFLTVAMIVTDCKGENILDEFYVGVKDAQMLAKESWVQENVIGKMGSYEVCEDEAELLEKVWAFWMKYESCAYAVADVQYPVEVRLFQKCVEKETKIRQWKAPFPMLDLSTILYWEGFDPLCERMELLDNRGGEALHNALYDVKMSKVIWRKLTDRRKA